MGDFNATTSLAFQKCEFDGTKVLTDKDCNANGYRLKTFVGITGFAYQQRSLTFQCETECGVL